jgi:hypothetical protein
MSRLVYNRRFIISLLAIGAVPAVFGAYSIIGGVVRCAAPGQGSASLAVIGRAYLAEYPEEASTDRLVAKLAQSSSEVVAALRSGTFEEALDAARRDLVRPEAEMVRCDGWLLGRAEARCAALVTLASGSV